jgi:hypothetical protein
MEVESLLKKMTFFETLKKRPSEALFRVLQKRNFRESLQQTAG